MTARQKIRLDVLLVEKGHFPSREKARAAVMAGEVLVEGQRALKPGTAVDSASTLEIIRQRPLYVSRGGHKLEKALAEFAIDVSGKTLLDVGASTGGFSDCALKKGARKIFAVDVGYGQLAWSIRQDPRVISLERHNIRNLQPKDLDFTPIDLAMVDVSFISLGLVLPVLKGLGIKTVIALVKPQFEAGKEQVGRGGVVREPRIHLSVLEKVVQKAAREGYSLHNMTYSPIKGPKGNIEYLICISREKPHQEPPPAAKIVAEAHESLKK